MDSVLYYRTPSASKKSGHLKEKVLQRDVALMGSVGKDLDHLEKERAIHTDPEETRRRRTIKLKRKNGETWGFTLQTYGIKNKKTQQVEWMTYVDYVEPIKGAAYIAGMRQGDVILSVNGDSTEGMTHDVLVKAIQNSTDTLWLVVLFEDCTRKIELYQRYIQLKSLLRQKRSELRHAEEKERVLLEKAGGRLNRLGSLRGSIRSSNSEWDTYSLISASHMETGTLQQRLWRQQHFFAGSTDTLSNVSLSNLPSPFGSSRESLDGGGIMMKEPCQRSLSSNDSGTTNSLTSYTEVLVNKRPSSDSIVTNTTLRSAHGATAGHIAEAMNGTRGGSAKHSKQEKEKPDHELGACGIDYSRVSALSPSPSECEIQERDEEAATLRRPKRTNSKAQKEEDDDEPQIPPVGRRRSSSLLINEMRMKLLADAVNSEIVEATKHQIEEMINHGHSEECIRSSITNLHNLESESNGQGYGSAKHGNGSDVELSKMGHNGSCGCNGNAGNTHHNEDNCASLLPESDITVVKDEANVMCRLYKGVRINDTTQDTRL